MPGKHAKLSPSGSHRWMACPGSVRLEEPFPDTSSPEAIEGTAAHMLTEMVLTGEIESAASWIGETILVPEEEGQDYTAIVVTRDMAGFVQVFIDAVMEAAGDDKVYSEVYVPLSMLAEKHGIEGMDGGTVDALVYHPADRSLDVMDLKYGTGVVVEVEGNTQLLMYALAAAMHVVAGTGEALTEIRTTIGQPRAPHEDGPIRTATYTWEDITLFAKELVAAAQETQRADAPLVPGDKQCKFCRAKAVCPALRDLTVQTVQNEFAVLAGVEDDTPPPLPQPQDLTPEQVAAILGATPLIRLFLSDVAEYATQVLSQGGEIPYHKLVEGRRSREWKDEEKAVGYLSRKLGGKGNAVVTKPLSPAQAEKALKAEFGEVPPYLENLIKWEDGAPRLAHESNKKPAITVASAAQNAFDVVDSSTEEK